MNKVKVFISYCTADSEKKDSLKNLINNCEKLEAIVVPEEQSDLEYNPEKIKYHLDKCKVFLPILTSNSINNQWVNQEIGYTFGSNRIKTENIYPLVEKGISSDLKGFISNSVDLNYRYENDFDVVAERLVNKLKEKFKNYGEYYIS